MRTFNFLTYLVLFVTTPSFLLYPQATFSTVALEAQIETDYTLSYDDILHVLDEIESGELEEKCTSEQLEKVKHFIAFLAKEGALPDCSEESLSLEEDIEELLHGEENLYKDAFSVTIQVG